MHLVPSSAVGMLKSLRKLTVGSRSNSNHHSGRLLAMLLLFALTAFGSTARGADAGSKSQRASATSSAASQPKLSGITIQATRERQALRRRVNKFVNTVLVRHWNETIVRWDVPICLLVAGLPRQYGEFVFERISQAAKDAHARLAKKDCHPNLYVVVTDDPEQLLKKWWNRDPMMYNTQEGIEPVWSFIKSKRPIRVWHNKDTRCRGGAPISSGSAAALVGIGSDLPGVSPPVAMGGGCMDTLLQYGAIRYITSAVVVVDGRQTKNVSLGQMADYVALVGLARVRADASDRAPVQSILSLFGHGKPPQGLTAWDRALLYALYNTDESDKVRVQELEWVMTNRIVPSPPRPIRQQEALRGSR